MQGLLRLARGQQNVQKKTPSSVEATLIIEDGVILDANTGFLVRRQLVLDEGPILCSAVYLR